MTDPTPNAALITVPTPAGQAALDAAEVPGRKAPRRARDAARHQGGLEPLRGLVRRFCDLILVSLALSMPWNEEMIAMRPWLIAVLFALIGCSSAWAACAGSPYDQFDFWLGSWHDPASPAAEHYVVTRTVGGCAIEEILTGGDGKIQGIGLSGWDTERKTWRQFWVDADKAVTIYNGAPGPDSSFVLTSDLKAGGKQSRYTYRNIWPYSVDADYATRNAPDAPWSTIWKGHYDRAAPADK